MPARSYLAIYWMVLIPGDQLWACGRAWRGRVALLRDRRGTSGDFLLLITLRNYILFPPLLTFYERATPVAQERNPTAPRVPTRRDVPVDRLIVSMIGETLY